MDFSAALSGLNAASTSLQVLGNNISNANTTGFKESRAEFADVYNITGTVTPGSGVRVAAVAQQFNQGNIETTQNKLDLALSGNGFFAMGENIDSTIPSVYTRNGAFHLDSEGYIVNTAGQYLMGGVPLGTEVEDGFNTGAPAPFRIESSQGAPAATTEIDLSFNLDSRDGRPITAFTGYDYTLNSGPDVDSYNSSTSATIFDSLGNAHTLTTYFVDETPDGSATSLWAAYAYLDGRGLEVGPTSTTIANPDSDLSTSILNVASDPLVAAEIDNVTAADAAVVAADNVVTAANTTVASMADLTVATTNTITGITSTQAAIAAVADPLNPTSIEVAAIVTAAAAAVIDADNAATEATNAANNAANALALDPTDADLIAANNSAQTALVSATTAATDAATAATAAAAIVDAATLTTATTASTTALASATTSDANATTANNDAITAAATATTNAATAAATATAANIVAMNSAVAAISSVSGVTLAQVNAATAETSQPNATVATVLAAAANQNLSGSRIPLEFDSLGNLIADSTGTDTLSGNNSDNFVFNNIDIAPLVALDVSAEPLSFTLNPTNSTQYAANFGVNDLQQNGFASGNLTGVSVDKSGVVSARYSNGTSNPLGQILLGRFTNDQGLEKAGDTSWLESVSSGTVVLGVAGGNNFGDIQSSALENSNTDIATQLVKMIVAQQAYQANSNTISTQNEVLQTILNI